MTRAAMQWPTTRAALRRVIPRHYGKPKGWPRSKVVRRDPETYQDKPRDVGIVRCVNWPCKLWIPSGSPRCPHCHERQA